jgi:hypothetical protein
MFGIPFVWAWFGSLIICTGLAIALLTLQPSAEWIAAYNDFVRKKIAADEQMVCPHCQVRGKVVTEAKMVKVGISGGKATAALLTGGVSLLGTGLAQKEERTKATCNNCQSTWMF